MELPDNIIELANYRQQKMRVSATAPARQVQKKAEASYQLHFPRRPQLHQQPPRQAQPHREEELYREIFAQLTLEQNQRRRTLRIFMALFVGALLAMSLSCLYFLYTVSQA